MGGEYPKFFFARIFHLETTMRAVGIEKTESEIVQIILRQLPECYDLVKRITLADPQLNRPKLENTIRSVYSQRKAHEITKQWPAVGVLAEPSNLHALSHGGGMPRQQQQQQHWSCGGGMPRQQQQQQHWSRDGGMSRQQQQQQHWSRGGGMPWQQQQQQHWSRGGGMPREQQQQHWSRGGGMPRQQQQQHKWSRGRGGAARVPYSADETAALTAAPSTGDTTAPDASVERAARQLTLEESSAGTASSDAVAEAAPLTGDTAASDASVERVARKLTLKAGSSSEICSERGASTHPFGPGTVFPLEVRYYNSSWPKHGSNSNSSSSSNSSRNGSSSRSSNDTTSNHDSWWGATCVGAMLRPFDPGKQCRRSARRVKTVLGLDLPFDRGRAWRRMQHGG